MTQATLNNYEAYKVDEKIATQLQRLDELINSGKYPIAKESFIKDKAKLLDEIKRQRSVRKK